MPRKYRFRNSRRSRPPGNRISLRMIVRHRFKLLLIGILALVALGIGLRHLETVAAERSARPGRSGENETSLLDPLNPFRAPPSVRNTPATKGNPRSVDFANNVHDVSQP